MPSKFYDRLTALECQYDLLIHQPNEKFDLVNFYKGIETIPYFHQYFAEMK